MEWIITLPLMSGVTEAMTTMSLNFIEKCGADKNFHTFEGRVNINPDRYVKNNLYTIFKSIV